MVNSSLRQGRLPDSQKHAVVTPLLKRPELDTADMANYSPVSNVTFMSKIVERAVTQQLHQYLADNDLLPRYQSAYRRHHSTETAMLRVLSDVITAADGMMLSRSRCLVYWICQQRSTASITSFCCSDFDETLDLPRQCLRGRRRLSPAELNKCYTRAAFQLFNLSSMGSHRDLSLVPCCLSCIQQKLAESLLSTGSSSTSMPTTAKFTSPCQFFFFSYACHLP